MEWKRAILEVLGSSAEPMHYSDIAVEVAKRRLRKKTELGATPANTVAVTISNSFRDDGEESPFIRVTRGIYALRRPEQQQAIVQVEDDALISPVAGIINALGMFWEREKVSWKAEPKLLGRQQQDSEPIDFSKQRGVYLLHDSQGVVYVGRITDQPLGRRLQQHNVDRLNGRWNRFSWFGVYPVKSDGSLKTDVDMTKVSIDIVISTLEAVLIEGLEPRQNRRRGDDFQAVEFLQAEDPALEQSRQKIMLADLLAKVSPKL